MRSDVVITRAAKRNGSPMVPSRFLQRLKAFIGARGLGGREKPRRPLSRPRARRSTRRTHAPPLRRPAPKPDPVLFPFPRTLSVTEIETLVRDPYSIYAKPHPES